MQAMVNAGYNGIELNSFMVNPTPFMVRMLTMVAGMPTGKGGNLDWAKLVKEAGLSVVSLHKDLGGIEKELAKTVREAENTIPPMLLLQECTALIIAIRRRLQTCVKGSMKLEKTESRGYKSLISQS